MGLTVKEVSQLSGVSVRTLHYYDGIGLLKPAYIGDNGYRYYEEEQLLRLQQILFYRELGMALSDIGPILDSGHFDRIEALQLHRQMLLEQAERIQTLVQTIDKTIHHLKGEYTMTREEFYFGFDRKKQAQYEKEIVDRYGSGGQDLIAESREKMKNWTKQDFEDVKAVTDQIHRDLTAAIERGEQADSRSVQEIIKRHYEMVKRFYTPTKEVYSGLGDLYVDHPDFRTLYDSFHPRLAEFLRDAMRHYAERELS